MAHVLIVLAVVVVLFGLNYLVIVRPRKARVRRGDQYPPPLSPEGRAIRRSQRRDN